MVRTRVFASVKAIKRASSIRRLDAFQGKKKKKTLSNNNIKCGKLLIGYSKINCITNYTTTGKYCKLINCSAWWRLMSPTAPVVPFSNLLATVFFKKHNSLKKSRVRCNWCVLCCRIKRESILSLCEPRSYFSEFSCSDVWSTDHTSHFYTKCFFVGQWGKFAWSTGHEWNLHRELFNSDMKFQNIQMKTAGFCPQNFSKKH